MLAASHTWFQTAMVVPIARLSVAFRSPRRVQSPCVCKFHSVADRRCDWVTDRIESLRGLRHQRSAGGEVSSHRTQMIAIGLAPLDWLEWSSPWPSMEAWSRLVPEEADDELKSGSVIPARPERTTSQSPGYPLALAALDPLPIPRPDKFRQQDQRSHSGNNAEDGPKRQGLQPRPYAQYVDVHRSNQP